MAGGLHRLTQKHLYIMSRAHIVITIIQMYIQSYRSYRYTKLYTVLYVDITIRKRYHIPPPTVFLPLFSLSSYP